MENIDEQIEQTEKEIDTLNDKLKALKDKKLMQKYEGISLQNKFIYHPRIGYMYVYLQTESFTRNNSVLLRGVQFDFDFGGNIEDNWFTFSDTEDKYINIVEFIKEYKNGKLREISKDEFMKMFNEGRKMLSKQLEYVLKKVTQNEI